MRPICIFFGGATARGGPWPPSICIWRTCKRQNYEGYYCWVWHILHMELKLKNKITAVNILAVPFLLYSFRRVNWLRKEIENVDQTMRNSSLLMKESTT